MPVNGSWTFLLDSSCELSGHQEISCIILFRADNFVPVSIEGSMFRNSEGKRSGMMVQTQPSREVTPHVLTLSTRPIHIFTISHLLLEPPNLWRVTHHLHSIVCCTLSCKPQLFFTLYHTVVSCFSFFDNVTACVIAT